MRRLEAATPLSMAEIQADKDQLRAEFAMSTRRLEMSVEQLKTKTTSQLAELGKKSDAINRLKIELGEKTATIFALEAREKALRDQLRATEEEVTAKTSIMHDAERTLSDKEAELAKLIGALDERSTLADSPEDRDRRAQDPGRGAERTAHRCRQRAQDGGRPPRCRAGRAQARDPGIGGRARPGREPRPPRRRTRTATGGADHGSGDSRPPRAGSGKPPRRAVAAAQSKRLRAQSTARRNRRGAQDRKRPAHRHRRDRQAAPVRRPRSSRRKKLSCSPNSAARPTNATGSPATSPI